MTSSSPPWQIALVTCRHIYGAAVGLALAVVAWGAAETRYLSCRAERHGATR
jgi:hypothetical protein